MARDEEDEITLEGTLGLIKPDSVRNEIHIMERVRYALFKAKPIENFTIQSTLESVVG